ncbi:hypothetical protein B0H13DRAFT_1853385 [Mycena leptocephala]|nr:hypothetical protein B0H13DRAFT_1853385 [Mycena leptocephala]
MSSSSLRRSARLAVFASQSNKGDIQGQHDALPAFLNSREQPGSTRRKRTTTDSEWGENAEALAYWLPIPAEAAIHMDWERVSATYRSARDTIIRDDYAKPRRLSFYKRHVLTPLHTCPAGLSIARLARRSVMTSQSCDIPPLPLNHLEDFPEQRRLVEAYFYAPPPLISLRVTILRNKPSPSASSAWDASRSSKDGRLGNGTLTPRTPMHLSTGQQMTGVGRGPLWIRPAELRGALTHLLLALTHSYVTKLRDGPAIEHFTHAYSLFPSGRRMRRIQKHNEGFDAKVKGDDGRGVEEQQSRNICVGDKAGLERATQDSAIRFHPCGDIQIFRPMISTAARWDTILITGGEDI